MSLTIRLCGRYEDGTGSEDIDKIAIDQFSALLIEYTFDSVTRQQIIDSIGMDVGEIAELDALLAKGNNQAARRELYTRVRAVLHLAEGNFPGYGLPSNLQSFVDAL